MHAKAQPPLSDGVNPTEDAIDDALRDEPCPRTEVHDLHPLTQIDVIAEGGAVVQETRLWDQNKACI